MRLLYTRSVKHQPNWHRNLEPTAGFEPATRCLQIRQQLNSARNFGFPCIRNASIWSQVFLQLGYKIGYRKSSPFRARETYARRLSGWHVLERAASYRYGLVRMGSARGDSWCGGSRRRGGWPQP